MDTPHGIMLRIYLALGRHHRQREGSRQVCYTCPFEMAANVGGFSSLQPVVIRVCTALSYISLIVHRDRA
ncbi:uncharacterized protein DS421_14g466380 [Arachis hypogaea]|nr:uncharacterized protein DS421_14g466380 [Arachis hypogaea]